MAIIKVERLNWQYLYPWLVATLPTLLLALPALTGLKGFMRIAGGAMAILVALLVITALCISRAVIKKSTFDLGVFGGVSIQLTVFIAYIFIVVGFLIPIYIC